ncbi:cutinase family protein [Nocardia zapadnayensis]|nr:cutinase family protein [Nocardia zapadnayensis]MCX0275453.1 cutinase family protein [Nocardia zapadnayensis]
MPTRWKSGVAACVFALVAAVVQAGGTPVAAATPTPCPDLYVVAIPGTWETSDTEPGTGMLAATVDRLPGNVAVDYVAYAATAFPWEGEVYGRSKQEATDRARDMVAAAARACPATRIAILGYSQGAHAAGDLAAEIGAGSATAPAERIALVGLIADPRRSPADTLIGPAVPGAGAVGARPGGFGALGPRTYTFCVDGDLYCAMPDGDIAGRLAGLVVQMSNPDPADIGSYQRQVAALFGDALAAGGLGLLAEEFDASAYEQRRKQIDDFLKSGAHQSYPAYVVDPAGATALTWLRQRLIEATNY